jgi:hypothetical protein
MALIRGPIGPTHTLVALPSKDRFMWTSVGGPFGPSQRRTT